MNVKNLIDDLRQLEMSPSVQLLIMDACNRLEKAQKLCEEMTEQFNDAALYNLGKQTPFITVPVVESYRITTNAWRQKLQEALA